LAPPVPIADAVAKKEEHADACAYRKSRKVKKLKLLEFTGGCRMSGQFTKVGLNGT
jgi:hypothetical protein